MVCGNELKLADDHLDHNCAGAASAEEATQACLSRVTGRFVIGSLVVILIPDAWGLQRRRLKHACHVQGLLCEGQLDLEGTEKLAGCIMWG